MKKEILFPLAVVAIIAAIGFLIFSVVKTGDTTAVSTPDPKAVRQHMMGSQGKMPAPVRPSAPPAGR